MSEIYITPKKHFAKVELFGLVRLGEEREKKSGDLDIEMLADALIKFRGRNIRVTIEQYDQKPETQSQSQ